MSTSLGPGLAQSHGANPNNPVVNHVFVSQAVALAAATPLPLTGSTFEGGDGNLKIDNNALIDWNKFSYNPNTGAVTGVPDGYSFSAAIDRPTGDDNIFDEGPKEDQVSPATKIANNTTSKSSLARAYVASEVRNDKTLLYLGWVRDGDSTGSVTVSYELNKAGVPAGNTPGCTPNLDKDCTWPTRTSGDLLITYDFQPNKEPTIEIRTWNDSDWVNPVTPNPSFVQAWVNTGPVTDSVLTTGNQELAAERFGEVALDLTGLGIIPSNSCAGFGAATVKTRQSNSMNSALEDFISPAPIVVGNCKLEVKKAIVPASDPGKFNLLVDGAIKKNDAQDGQGTGPVPVTTSSRAIPIAEQAGTGTNLSNYSTSLACVLRGTTETIPVTAGALNQSGSVGPLTNGNDVVCTITNTRQTGKLEVVKDLNPSSDPGLFNLQIDGTTRRRPTSATAARPVEQTLNTGTHTVGETAGTGTTWRTTPRRSSARTATALVAAWPEPGRRPAERQRDQRLGHRLHDHQHPGDRQAGGRQGPEPEQRPGHVQPADRRHHRDRRPTSATAARPASRR